MLTISALARQFGLSRSTLLYYDRLGLLCPSGRSQAGYRLYNDADCARLARITTLSAAGMPLAQIAGILAEGEDPARGKLEAHLALLNTRRAELQRQQQQVLALLGRTEHVGGPLNKQPWVALLRRGGMDDKGMWRFHVAFEQTNPMGHEEFLVSMGLAADEIAAIRTRSRQSAAQPDDCVPGAQEDGREARR